MTRAKILQKNPGHDRAEHTDFVSRLRFKKEGEVALKSDCINLAIQYVAVYQAMERRLSEIINENTPYLTIFNQAPWLDRSRLLEDDIEEMTSFVSAEEKGAVLADNKLFPATEKMVADIKQADGMKLFSWLAVRCLGDAFGGQGLKGHNQKIFGDEQLTANFANGVSREALKLCRVVNHAVMTDDEEALFYSTADTVFELHVALFEEMETARVLPEHLEENWASILEMQPERRPIRVDEMEQEFTVPARQINHSNYSSGCRFMMFTAVAAAGAAVTLATAYGSMTSPQQ